MYTIVLIIQYTSIVALFIEGWVVFRKWSSKLHAYLFFSASLSICFSVYGLSGFHVIDLMIRLPLRNCA